jgi:hypothetical protein
MSHRWPAVPVWDVAVDLFREIRSVELPDRLADAVASASADSFLENVASASRSVLLEALDGAGTDVTGLSDDELWARVQGDPWARHARDALRAPRARHERLAQVYVDSARTFAKHASAEMGSQDWVGQRLAECDGVRLLGDMHARGSVVALYRAGTPQIIFKPRSMSSDALVADAIGAVATGLEAVAPFHPRFVDRGTHGWQEYAPFGDPSRLGEFYYRFGGLVAIATLLQVSDLHFENVKCVGGAPAVLDPECALSRVASDLLSPGSDALYRPTFSVLSTQLTPNWSARFGTADPSDCSALGSYGVADRAEPLRVLAREDGNLVWRFESATGALERPTLPSTRRPGARMPFEGFEPLIERGFHDAAGPLADWLATARSRIEHGIVVRVLRRSTSVYTALLESGGDIRVPSHSSSVGAASRREAELDEWFRAQEDAQLAVGVIPTFEVALPAGRLWSGLGASLDLGRDRASAAIDDFAAGATTSDQAWAMQGQILRASLSLGSESSDDGGTALVGNSTRARVPTWPRSVVEGRIRSVACFLADTVLLGDDAVPRWITSDELGHRRFRLSTTEPGLYAGLAGVTYALAVAGLEDAAAARLCDDLHAALEASFTAAADLVLDGRVGGRAWTDGVGSGTLGVLAALLATEELRLGRVGPHWAGVVERLLPALTGSSAELDFLGGSTGRAHVLRLVGEQVGSPDVVAAGEALLDATLPGIARAVGPRDVELGIAHGLSGMALTLHGYSARRPEWDALARRLLTAEDALLSAGGGKRGSEPVGSWCWGTLGLLETRLAVGADERVLAGLAAENETLEVSGLTLCHGLLGRAVVLRSSAYVNRFGSVAHEECDRAVADRLDAYGINDGRPAHAQLPGLFTGMGGLLVYLSAVRDNAQFQLSSLRYERAEAV